MKTRMKIVLSAVFQESGQKRHVRVLEELPGPEEARRSFDEWCRAVELFGWSGSLWLDAVHETGVAVVLLSRSF